MRGLRHKLLLWAVPGILLIGIGALLFARAANRSVEKRELLVHQSQVAKARSQLDSMRQRLKTGVMEYALWDPMLEIVARPDLLDAAEEARWLRENYQSDFVVFINSAGRVVYAADPTGHHRPGNQVGDSPLVRMAVERPGEAALWRRAGTPVYLVAAMIQGFDAEYELRPYSESEGFILIGQTLSDEFLRGLSAILGGTVRIEYGDEFAATAEDSDLIEILAGPDGKPAAALVLTADPGVSGPRWAGFGAIVVYFLVAQLVGLVLLILASDRAIIRPLLTLQRGIAELQAKGALSARLLPERQDELGVLAQNIFQLSAALEEAEKLRTHDVAALLESQKQLRQAQKMEAVGQLTGGIAHDFNNLLTPIIGFSELALQKLSSDDPLRRDLMMISGAGEKAADLIQQLLAFSRQQVLEARVVDLNALVAEFKKLLRRTIGEDIEFKTVLDPAPGNVKVDPGQTEQVLMNLAINSRDAMPEGGTLTIETQNVVLDEAYSNQHPGMTPGPHVMLAVTDTGVGMDEEIQRHIFEPFFSTKETGEGTGLGLATVYGIVKQSNGYISVDSELGKGTTFRIYLPRVEAAAGRAKQEEVTAQPEGGSEAILVVEDDETVRLIAVLALEEKGYRVLSAEHPAQALVVCRDYEDPIDLLVTDLMMPGSTGIELAEQLLKTRPGTKVLFISGYADKTALRSGELDPSAEFLGKPFTASVLARKVREILDGRST